MPARDAYGSAFLLEIGKESALVDCGPAATYKMARMGIAPIGINHVFFTHHHFDHNVDFPCFALTRWDACNGAEPPLRVYGPPPTRIFVERLLGREGAFFDDWHSRITHPASHKCFEMHGGVLPRPPPKIAARDVEPGAVAETAEWRATAARVRHVEPTLQSLAYRFETAEGSVVFAGDCADCPELRQFAMKVDTLVVACTHFGRSHTSPAIADVITGTEEAAAIGNECGARRLVLTHVNSHFLRPDTRARAIAEIARTYPGEILFPNELTAVELRK